MKLQFDANQDYQLAAIRAAADLFKGQPDASQTAVSRDDALSSLHLTETGVANRRVIDAAQCVANYRAHGEDGSTVKGKFARWFEEIYARFGADPDYAGLMPQTAEQARNGYFSQDKHAVSPFATLTGKSNAEAESSAFELIMRNATRSACST